MLMADTTQAYYFSEEAVKSATLGLWPGHSFMATHGCMLADSCWTAESLVLFFT